MIWRPPRSKQTDTLFPDATLCRSEVTLEEVDYDAAAVGFATEQFLGGELHVVRRFFAGVVAPVANCGGKRPLLASPMRDGSHSSAAVRRHSTMPPHVLVAHAYSLPDLEGGCLPGCRVPFGIHGPRPGERSHQSGEAL